MYTSFDGHRWYDCFIQVVFEMILMFVLQTLEIVTLITTIGSAS